MSLSGLPAPTPSRGPTGAECSNPALGKEMTGYCFGDATEQERRRFEAHLLECDACWNEVRKLDASVGRLRSDRSLIRSLLTPEVVGVFGVSGRMSRLLGGHLWFALGAGLLYALLYAISFVAEIAYEFDAYGKSAVLLAAAVVVPWMAVTTVTALAADWFLTLRGRKSGLAASFSICAVAVAALLIVAWQFLPGRPVTLARIQTYPAQAAYLKNVVYYFPLCAVFLLAPFHAVLALQRDLTNQRHRQVSGLLNREATAVPPRGTVFVRIWQLAAVLGGAVFASLYLTTNLMDNLKPAPHMSLFVNLIQLRTLCYFGMATACLVWYSRLLSEIKRECIVVLRANSV